MNFKYVVVNVEVNFKYLVVNVEVNFKYLIVNVEVNFKYVVVNSNSTCQVNSYKISKLTYLPKVKLT